MNIEYMTRLIQVSTLCIRIFCRIVIKEVVCLLAETHSFIYIINTTFCMWRLIIGSALIRLQFIIFGIFN